MQRCRQGSRVFLWTSSRPSSGLRWERGTSVLRAQLPSSISADWEQPRCLPSHKHIVVKGDPCLRDVFKAGFRGVLLLNGEAVSRGLQFVPIHASFLRQRLIVFHGPASARSLVISHICCKCFHLLLGRLYPHCLNEPVQTNSLLSLFFILCFIIIFKQLGSQMLGYCSQLRAESQWLASNLSSSGSKAGHRSVFAWQFQEKTHIWLHRPRTHPVSTGKIIC